MAYDPDEFAGKRILVTGGTRGIGEATVNRLLLGGGFQKLELLSCAIEQLQNMPKLMPNLYAQASVDSSVTER